MEQYKTLRSVKNVFQKFGDSVMSAMSDVELANLFEYIGNSGMAIKNYDEASVHFQNSGVKCVLPRIEMNKAISLLNCTPRVGQKTFGVQFNYEAYL